MNRHLPSQTMSSREFNQNTGRAKAAADHAPVVITDRGSPAYVLMRYSEYQELVPQPETKAPFRSLADALFITDDGDDVDLMDFIHPRSDYPRDPFADDED